ncbi:hypothetical protein [Vibrio alginolyticus]|uniref:hypothetical protein n=1 Tax=Vibrio alginolyticus TaxID=663 RepID=UPI0006CA8AF6|nr:hypothetical protein [Vibrio alginolyticus]KPM98718.1 hypothetical protein AOG25_09975 [Vibrio alginolyticus]CAH7172945.1 conserved hypothetical protein [Vibrio chagasii]CAH7342245.1 conserved hypothetical protein [Vibrio chagasii]
METFNSFISIPMLLFAAIVCIFQWLGYSAVEASGYPLDDQFEVITPSEVSIVDSNLYVYSTDRNGNLTCFFTNEFEGSKKYLPTANLAAGDTMSVIGQSREVASSGILNYDLNDLITIKSVHKDAITIKFSSYYSSVELSNEDKLLNLHICEAI